MKAERWVPLVGFFVTDVVVLWIIFALATGQQVFFPGPLVIVVALFVSAALTLLYARRMRREDR